MIEEFAVEPESLSELNMVWQALDQFGVPHGRLISKMPSKWFKKVSEATYGRPDLERKNLEVRLISLRSKVVKIRNSTTWDSNLSWRDNIQNEDSKDEFRAIILKDNAVNNPRVLTSHDLHDANPLWQVSNQLNVPRTPDSIASVVGPLGRISKQLHFVDPYFSNEARFTSVLAECLRACEVTVNSHQIFVHTNQFPDKHSLCIGMNRHLVHDICKGVRVKFVLWKQKEMGEKFHARYFLTERGGIGIEVGLDAGEPGETTDVGLLSENLHRTRLDDFQALTAAYEKVDAFTVVGTS